MLSQRSQVADFQAKQADIELKRRIAFTAEQEIRALPVEYELPLEVLYRLARGNPRLNSRH